jgi:hypothetical protein
VTDVSTCLGLHIDCGTLTKGALAVLTAFVLFIGSIYVLLSAVFGRRLGYLVVAIAFFGWMILYSGLWAAGAPGTPRNLGPRGLEPGWVPLEGSFQANSSAYPEVAKYPNPPWKLPPPSLAASIQSVTGSIQEFLAEKANEQLGRDPLALNALPPTSFAVEDIRFASHGSTSLAAAKAFYTGGGPVITVFAYHNTGSVPRYSWMFLGLSVIGFLIHLPFLDKAERKRKQILTGGDAPPWYGPA